MVRARGTLARRSYDVRCGGEVGEDAAVLTGRPYQRMVPRRGLEPPRPCERQHLKLVRLPIPPPGHVGEQVGRRGELGGLATLVNAQASGQWGRAFGPRKSREFEWTA